MGHNDTTSRIVTLIPQLRFPEHGQVALNGRILRRRQQGQNDPLEALQVGQAPDQLAWPEVNWLQGRCLKAFLMAEHSHGMAPFAEELILIHSKVLAQALDCPRQLTIKFFPARVQERHVLQDPNG